MRKWRFASVINSQMRINSEKLMIPGAVGKLEGLLDQSEQSQLPYVSICCHPHPLHAGTMTNKVIHTAARALAGLGIPSIRFNFRGIGESEGEYGEGIGEQADLVAVVKWVLREFPQKKLILAGFSFGAYISALKSSELKPEILISIAPPVGRIPFDGFVRPFCPWLIIQGEQDELVDVNAVIDWTNSFEQPPTLLTMPDTSHFFHGKLVDLRESIEEYCSKQLGLG